MHAQQPNFRLIIVQCVRYGLVLPVTVSVDTVYIKVILSEGAVTEGIPLYVKVLLV